MANVLVTGGSGFIGSHVVDKLVDAGHNVFVIDINAKNKSTNGKAKYYVTDLTKTTKESLAEIIKEDGIKFVFHLAAQINLRASFDDMTFDADTNVVATIRLAEVVKYYGVKFIFASTGGAIYSEQEPTPWDENTTAQPMSPYGLSKLCAENYLKLLFNNCPNQLTILRLSNVYGPRQNPHGEAGVVAIFLENIFNGTQCTIFGDGKQIRDYVYVEDVANAFVRAMTESVHGIWNISTGVGVNLNDLTLMLLSKSELKSTIRYAPAKSGEMKVSLLNSDKYKHLSGGYVGLTCLSDGLDKTVEWYRNKSNEPWVR